jgi:ferric-dicitrate binding protein FerR (iron transport regulator)
MTAQHEDYLWDPDAAPDPEIVRLERLLQPLSASALQLDRLAVSIPQQFSRPFAWRRSVAAATIAASLLIALCSVHFRRLSWEDGSPWPVTLVTAAGAARIAELRVGERVITNAGETALLNAARIGSVTLAPSSIARLIRTRKGHHRIELEQGRLHAKVWAPPNHFGVTHGDARFTDLGCEFDLSVEGQGSGTLIVASG